jgi:hypothetical protein
MPAHATTGTAVALYSMPYPIGRYRRGFGTAYSTQTRRAFVATQVEPDLLGLPVSVYLHSEHARACGRYCKTPLPLHACTA